MGEGGNMKITVPAELEQKIRDRAEAQGLSVEAYLEQLVRADQQGMEELEDLALEGLDSGSPIEAGPSYWEEKHRRLEERLKGVKARRKIGTR
jgi:hypothetical protein